MNLVRAAISKNSPLSLPFIYKLRVGRKNCLDSMFRSTSIPVQDVDLIGLEPSIDVYHVGVISGDKDNSAKSFTASSTVREYRSLVRSKL